MKRRSFLGSGLAAGMSGALTASCGGQRLPWETGKSREELIPDTIAGLTLEELREDYRHRLFDLYLPFWDNGAIDPVTGAVRCLLNDNGSVAEDDVYNWYQGRALWVYSFLYNNLGQDPAHLETATKIRDFMVTYMQAGSGTWYEHVYSDGRQKEGVRDNISGWLFAANGLAEFYKATQNEEDLKIMIETVWAALRAYDSTNYTGVSNYGGLAQDVSFAGFRSQGHSMVLVRMLSQLLSHTRNRKMAEILNEHVSLIMENFFNPRLGITNEYLQHNYARIPGYEDYMYLGHSLETMWIIMFEAVRSGDSTLFEDSKNTIRRYVEMGWDYVFDGFGDGHYYVFDGPGRTRVKQYDVKSMWSHCELMIALLHILEYTGEQWAKDWYERVWTYSIQKFDTDYGVWRQAVDRFGRDVPRDSVPLKRKGNFHQPRWLMLNMLCLDRMIDAKGETEPTPL